MDFTTIGSVGQYTKNLGMQIKWQNRQKSGNYAPEEKSVKEKVAEWAEKQKDSITNNFDNEDNQQGYDKSKDKTLKTIADKLTRGEKLSFSERQYLKSKDPSTYQKLVDSEIEQAYYEQQLRRCRSKDEFQRMRMARAVYSLGTVNSVRNNPSITQEKKLEVISAEQIKAAAAERTEREFVKSGRYSSLPTEAERRYAAKKLAEAERNERRAKKDETEKKVVVEKPKVTEKDRKDVKAKTKTVTKKKYRIKRGINKAQAEQLPQVKKTRRANKRSGIAVSGKAAFAAQVIVKSLDIKA